MSEVLVVVDHVDGAIRKPTFELLTLARRLGEASAVFFGSADKGAEVASRLGQHGAEKVYVVDDTEIKGYLVAPKAEVLAHGRGDKIRIVKHRRRKHYHKEQGHRQNFTEVKVTGISV